jgi:hypothetical protein
VFKINLCECWASANGIDIDNDIDAAGEKLCRQSLHGNSFGYELVADHDFEFLTGGNIDIDTSTKSKQSLFRNIDIDNSPKSKRHFFCFRGQRSVPSHLCTTAATTATGGTDESLPTCRSQRCKNNCDQIGRHMGNIGHYLPCFQIFHLTRASFVFKNRSIPSKDDPK